MAERLLAHTPLGGEVGRDLRSHGVAFGVMLREVPAAGMIDVRVNPTDRVALAAIQDSLGLELPMVPGKSNGNDRHLALWFGPDQWLIVAPDGDAIKLVDSLDADNISAVDVSDLRAQFELAGPLAADVLRKGCGIDLHPRAFKAGDCALTALARVRVALLHTSEAHTYRIFVERSVAPYLWDWLVDAMIEFTGRKPRAVNEESC
jgi:sarcosine oxidase, subunit gamma